jgi:hypothetical protein
MALWWISTLFVKLFQLLRTSQRICLSLTKRMSTILFVFTVSKATGQNDYFCVIDVMMPGTQNVSIRPCHAFLVVIGTALDANPSHAVPRHRAQASAVLLSFTRLSDRLEKTVELQRPRAMDACNCHSSPSR